MKKHRKTMVILAVIVLALVLVADFFHVSGKEFSWAALASDEAVITVEEWDDTGAKILATHALTRGEGVALQSLLLRTHYLRSFSDSVGANSGENTYRIFIRFPSRDVSLHLAGSRYLSGENGWLKILDKDWELAFHGILDAG